MRPKVILFSSLFPNPRNPLSGMFVSELTNALSMISDVSVLAPVIAHRHLTAIWGIPRKYCLSERVRVWAPIVINFPKILKSTDGALMAACSSSAFEQAKGGHADLVHAHFAYPDGVAAWKLARRHHLPLIVTIHGSDINVLAKDAGRRKQIVEMLNGAAAIVCVARDLLEKVVAMGIAPDRVYHIPNGVDTRIFTPGDKQAHRNQLGLNHHKRLLLTVGNLIPVKGYDRMIQALMDIDPSIGLVMVGEGPERSRLGKHVRRLGLGERVHFAGSVPHSELAAYYRAADFLVISSHSEGWPTVIFEALACGLPVIANRVGGIPEVLCSSDIGLLVESNDSPTIAAAIASSYKMEWDGRKAVSFAEKNTWNNIAEKYLKIYEHVQMQR
jgi:glycosyltransferase involved in cell wall biosynthesis